MIEVLTPNTGLLVMLAMLALGIIAGRMLVP